MTVWVFRPLIALSLAAVLAVGCSKKQSAEEQAEQAKATEDHILLGQIAAAAAQQGGGQMGGNGGQQMMGQGQGQMMGQGQGQMMGQGQGQMMGAGQGQGQMMGAGQGQGMGQGQMMGQGQGIGGAQRMSPRERALLKAQEAEKESEDAVEEFLAAVDKGDKKKMGTLVSKRSRGILKRLQDGSISDDDFNRVVEMYQDGKVGESTAASRSSERTVSVELPDRRRRVKVRAESDSWLISSLDGVR